MPMVKRQHVMVDNAWWSKLYGWKEKEREETRVPRLRPSPTSSGCQMVDVFSFQRKEEETERKTNDPASQWPASQLGLGEMMRLAPEDASILTSNLPFYDLNGTSGAPRDLCLQTAIEIMLSRASLMRATPKPLSVSSAQGTQQELCPSYLIPSTEPGEDIQDGSRLALADYTWEDGFIL
ncbi:hypothetical protein U0070_021336 [Myodes glareolus]|uniref:Uncharacterized protein n=1 Tax=Myodes glareolus TaxID=447135 RepID=A0AAW0JH71_MYOGA